MKKTHPDTDTKWMGRARRRQHAREAQKWRSRFRTYGIDDNGKVIETASWAPTQVPPSTRIATRRRRAKAARAARKVTRRNP